MKSEEMRKRIIMALPYVLIALIATHFGQAWRMSESSEPDMRVMGFLEILPSAFSDILPSFHPFDLLIGVTLAAIMRLIVYSKRKNAKKYREGIEYGSARWRA